MVKQRQIGEMMFGRKKKEAVLSDRSEASQDLILVSAKYLAMLELLIEKNVFTWEEFDNQCIRKLAELDQSLAELRES